MFFSIPFEPDYERVLEILKKWGIEPLREKRDYPILIAGGPATIMNPRPLLPFFDAIFIGEAEEIFSDIGWVFDKKEELLEFLSTKKWAIIPSQKENAERAYLKDLSRTKAFSAIISENSLFKMHLVEIQRGCPRKCRFCLLGHAYLPPRFVPFDVLKDIVKHGAKHSPSIGFVGSAILSHPQIMDILSFADRYFERFSFSSMGLSELVNNPELLSILKRKGAKTITIAPETGQSLRKSINKPYTDEEIFTLLHHMEKEGLMTLKLYFMIGLPEERIEHIVEIKNLIEEIHKNFKGIIRITISIFVPKFHTPLQDSPFSQKKDISEKLRIIRSINLKRVHINLPSFHHAKIETLSARGDEELGLALYRKVFHKEPLKMHINSDKYLYDISYIEKAIKTHPVRTGATNTFIQRERQKYSKQRLTPSCQPDFCRLCGICRN